MATTDSINQSSSNLNNYTSAASGNSALGSDAFMKLLVAQLQHQDPLNPQDNTEFVAQLAQFSSLEQQTETNKKMDQLLATQNSSAAFSLLGQDVVVATDSVYLQGDDIKLGFSLDQDAEQATVKVIDADGNEVASFNLDNPEEGQNFINWNGTDKSGEALPKGTYKLEVESKMPKARQSKTKRWSRSRLMKLLLIHPAASL